MTATITPSENPMLRVLGLRDFRLLWIGGTISVLGSQFSMIAMPWLVLQLTGDPLALGAVLALAGIPRAILMLVGGVATDRLSPRMILLVCDWLNFALTGITAGLVIAGLMHVWMLYILSLLNGLLSGFVSPAANSIMPRLVPENDLQAGNSIIMGSSQLAGFVGPSLAGIMIGIYARSTQGISIAFMVDAISFSVSAIALWLMSGGRQLVPSEDPETEKEGILASIKVGVQYFWKHTNLRFIFILMMAFNFLFNGPLQVGVPVLADQRLPGGARAFGFLMSAFAGGNLFGYLLAGALPRPTGRGLSMFLVALLASFGVVLCAMGGISLTWVDFILMLLLGVEAGYMSIILFTWIQQRTQKDMLGRMMSMISLATLGLMPLSQALSGVISKWSLTILFVVSGSLLLLTAFWTLLRPELKSLGEEMVSTERTGQA